MNRVVAILTLVALTACTKPAPGPASDASAETAAPTATSSADAASASGSVSAEADAALPAPLLTPPASASSASAPKKPLAGVKKPGAPAAEQCCCKVGKKHAFAVPTECASTMKGACVAMSECDARSCCCKSADMTVTRLMSACTEDHGTCVKKEQCQ